MSHCHSSSCNGGQVAAECQQHVGKRIVRVTALLSKTISTNDDSTYVTTENQTLTSSQCPNVNPPPDDGWTVDDNNTEQDTEREHFERILATFVHYKARSLRQLKKQLVFYSKLNARHQAILSGDGGYVAQLTKIKQCIDKNQTFLNQIIGDVNSMFENKPTPSDDGGMLEENSEMGNNSKHNPSRPILSERSVSEFNMEKLRSTLKQFVRDWSDEGNDERSVCYEPILKDLQRFFPEPENIEVLVPGAGLGRLAWEIARLGYNCEGNEFSLFMLFGSNFVLNRCKAANSITFYPFVHQWANNMSYDDQIRPVTIPDVDTSSALPEGVTFSMSAGDFTEIYAASRENWTDRGDDLNDSATPLSSSRLNDSTTPATGRFDCIITVFFLDTARNILDYLDVIATLLKPGAYWINFGPLLYHHTDDDGISSGCCQDDGTVPLAYRELKKIIVDEYKFEMLEELVHVPTTYAQNNRCMLKYTYDCVKFICKKSP